MTSPLPDFRTPSPDEGHEAIRAPLAQAIDDLADAIEAGHTNRAGVDDAYFLADMLFDLLGSALAAVDDLTARVTALEAAVVPPTDQPQEAAP